mmetsp:Transcript_19106/g.19375  ORF Transcript_19106/g.19375 Transcript_19106/m.19375 type:complete len:82 (-) Transcript_19106:644-889(-)
MNRMKRLVFPEGSRSLCLPWNKTNLLIETKKGYLQAIIRYRCSSVFWFLQFSYCKMHTTREIDERVVYHGFWKDLYAREEI